MDPLLLKILAAVLVLIGLAGTLLPILPGVPLIFVGLLVAAWAAGQLARVYSGCFRVAMNCFIAGESTLLRL